MLPKIWGRCAWNFLHFVTMDYPDNPTEEDKMHYYQYLTLLQYVLPCGKCRRHLTQHLKKYPLTADVLSSRTKLVKWGIDLHNVVNYYTGKEMLSYEQAFNELDKQIKGNKTNSKVLCVILIIAVIIIVALLCYYWLKN